MRPSNSKWIALLLMALASPAIVRAEEAAEIELFDGKTLEGWQQHNGWATYRVEDGMIVGKTAKGSPNSFLCTMKDYGDFELSFDVKVDNGLNSGVQFRSRSVKEYKDGRVHGPQVEIESSPGKSGYVYSEGTDRGWISSDPKTHELLKNEEWNTYRVRAEGARIETWINDKPVENLTDEESPKSGFIGLQVHGIGENGGPFQVRWRNIQLRELGEKK